MAELAQATVIDRDGVRGKIAAYHPQRKTFSVDVDNRRYELPAEVIAQRDGTHHMPLRFADLEAGAGEYSGVVIPVVSEELVIDKRAVETGTVRVSKIVHERTERVDEPLVADRVEIERVSINQFIGQPQEVRIEDGVTIIPVMREVLVVDKQLLLVEEIRLSRQRIETRHPQEITLREEEARVERLPADPAATE